MLEQVSASSSHTGQSGSSPVVVLLSVVVGVPLELPEPLPDPVPVVPTVSVAGPVWVVSSLPAHAGASEDTASATGMTRARLKGVGGRGRKARARYHGRGGATLSW